MLLGKGVAELKWEEEGWAMAKGETLFGSFLDYLV
jgi:hypothetical protein